MVKDQMTEVSKVKVVLVVHAVILVETMMELLPMAQQVMTAMVDKLILVIKFKICKQKKFLMLYKINFNYS